MSSQFGEDQWLLDNLILPKRGVFVDIGAGHPVDMSNTAAFREIGWTGVAVDANPYWAEAWKTLAPSFPFEVAVVSRLPQVRFELREDPLASGVNETGAAPKVYTNSICKVIDKYGIKRIDLLSVDVEGHELEVLQSFDWVARPKPKVIICEYRTYNVFDFSAINFLVSTLGYNIAHCTVCNLILTSHN